MNYFFLDASAAAKHYVSETGTPIVNHLFSAINHSRLFLLNIGIAEIVSILVRKRNKGLIVPAVYSQIYVNLASEIIHAPLPVKLDFENSTVVAALPHIEKYAINGTDAIILETIIRLTGQFRALANDVVLVSSDIRLIRAARAEGVVAFNPELEDQSVLDALL